MESIRFEPSQYRELPKEPGVYKFYDNTDTIVYVGKAKSLNNRVSSYFNKGGNTNRKTWRLVREIASIEIVIVNSEFDALLLENNLIKEHQPKYNMLLKDDKSFPSILVTNERFPRIYSTRHIDPKLGTYHGPYSSVKAMNGVLDLLRKLFKIRTCSLNLSQRNIEQGKFKVCLEYHIGNCLGPCEAYQTEEDYLKDIQGAQEILKGNINFVKNNYKQLMQEAAEKLYFEVAQDYKVKLDYLEKFQARSLIVNPKIDDVDVFGVIQDQDDGCYYINYMKVGQGSIRISETVEVKPRVEEEEIELLQIVLFSLRTKYGSHSLEVYTNKGMEGWDDLEVTTPKIGDKRKLLDLSLKNALYFKNDKQAKKVEREGGPNPVLLELQKDLNLNALPKHIECFDNSNIQGTNPVASMVCFRNGKPSKKDYRKYNIKTVIGPDDFSSMKEVVSRRYARLKDEGADMPDLIVIDGGKGQLSSACGALKSLDLYGDIPIIGIAKRLEEIYLPEDPIPVHISKKSPSLKLIQHLRDEAHRFAITFHRQKRSKASTVSALDGIDGIGPATRKKLFNAFKSLKRIQMASEEELAKVIGHSKAKALQKALKAKE